MLGTAGTEYQAVALRTRVCARALQRTEMQRHAHTWRDDAVVVRE